MKGKAKRKSEINSVKSNSNKKYFNSLISTVA